MNFAWTETQQEIYDHVLNYSQKSFQNTTVSIPETEFRKTWKEIAEIGLLGLAVDETYGGMGFDCVTSARAIEAFGTGCTDMGLVFAMGAHFNACVMPIFEFANESTKRDLLPNLCNGTWVGANAITEAGAGSDLATIKTTATKDGDHFLLNGVKTYVTNGPHADVFTVYASTSPEDGYMGVTAFAVEARTPGITVGKKFPKVGLHTAQTSAVYFDDCRVHKSRIMGGEGQGLSVFNQSMKWERSCLFAGYLGMMERVFNLTLDYAKQRKQFRRSIGKFQSVANRLVAMKERNEAARHLLYRACWEIDQNGDNPLYVALAKLTISEAAVQSGLDAISIHGGSGVVTEHEIPYALLNSLPATIFSGTSDLQRNIIAKELGL